MFKIDISEIKTPLFEIHPSKWGEFIGAVSQAETKYFEFLWSTTKMVIKFPTSEQLNVPLLDEALASPEAALYRVGSNPAWDWHGMPDTWEDHKKALRDLHSECVNILGWLHIQSGDSDFNKPLPESESQSVAEIVSKSPSELLAESQSQAESESRPQPIFKMETIFSLNINQVIILQAKEYNKKLDRLLYQVNSFSLKSMNADYIDNAKLFIKTLDLIIIEGNK